MDQKRYDRQIKLKELGKVGQQRLLDAHVTIVMSIDRFSILAMKRRPRLKP